MLSTKVVATRINNNSETTGKGRQWQPGQGPQIAQNGNFLSKYSAFARTPQRGNAQNKQVRRAGNCYNCGKPGYYARECCSAPKQNGPQPNGSRNNGNKIKQFAHKVSAIAEDNDAVVDEATEEGTIGYTSNNINSGPSCGVNKSPFPDTRKLTGVPGQIINYHNPCILVDSGSPVTIIRSDLWKQIKDPSTIVNEEEECFQGVTHDTLKIVGVTQLTLHFGKLQVKHPVLIVDNIAHKFILGNDVLTVQVRPTQLCKSYRVRW